MANIQKQNVVILLGAGASIDAGLPDTYKLTSTVYDRLSRSFDKTSATVFGYVVSKLVARGAREGESPFAIVNIEQVYDTIIRLMNRDADALSEFVYSWDPILDAVRKPFDERKFVREIKEAIELDTRRSLSGAPRINFRPFKLESAAREISRALVSSRVGDEGRRSVLPPIIKALVEELTATPTRTDYIDDLATFCKEGAVTVATLNYDTYLEDRLQECGVAFDYGLAGWNERKQVSWQRSRLKLLKLHGSVNWYEHGESIVSEKPEELWSDRRFMIFGGQADKLNPDGPYLQLRGEFERTLLRANRLLVVGYSFGDAHLNAILRSWVSTRKAAKLIDVDPGDISFSQNHIGRPFQSSGGVITKNTVDLVHIKETAAAGMSKALKQIRQRPRLKKVVQPRQASAREVSIVNYGS